MFVLEAPEILSKTAQVQQRHLTTLLIAATNVQKATTVRRIPILRQLALLAHTTSSWVQKISTNASDA